jgi:enoyl-[acyl-carrier-protein] reductase (NADH)
MSVWAASIMTKTSLCSEYALSKNFLKWKKKSALSENLLSNLNFWFFSDLVAESLIDFQCKVAQVVKAVSLAFDDFDLVVHSLQFSGVDGVVTVVCATSLIMIVFLTKIG